MGNLCPCLLTPEQRVVRAARRGSWSTVFCELVGPGSRGGMQLSESQELAIMTAAMWQDEYIKISTLLNRGYWFGLQPLEIMMNAAAAEHQLNFLACVLCTFRGYTFSWPCIVRALEAFASRDEYLEKARYLLLTSVPPDADMFLLEPIHDRLQERLSDNPHMQRAVLKQLSDLLKV